MNYYLAIDIGASSGRHIVGWTTNGEIVTDEVYRFANNVQRREGHLVWDTESLVANVVEGIKRALQKYPSIVSLGIDTWGCDYVLLKDEDMVKPCYSYRDDRTADVIEQVHSVVNFENLYRITGIQFQPFNTLYQLVKDKQCGRLKDVTDILMMPEYLTYRLTGVKIHEYTNATTTGFVNAFSEEYDKGITASLGLDERLFGKLFKAGKTVGDLLPSVQQAVGGNIKVVLCATHDTASAVEGIPMVGDAMYISSGTWSLLGVKLQRPHTDMSSLQSNFSNEGGVGYIRYQKNIMGMWVVNNLRKELCPDMPFYQITRLASESTCNCVVDINAPQFLSPQKMTEAFNQSVSDKFHGAGDYFKCAMVSLACSYRDAIAQLESNIGKRYSRVYIVGGGANNTYLNRLTAEITGKEVVALPIEATALGNLKVQMEKGE